MIADGSRASAEFRGGYILLNTAIQEYTHACQCKGSCASVAPPFQCEANMLSVDIAELYACVDGMSSGTSTEAVLKDGRILRLPRPKPASMRLAQAPSLFFSASSGLVLVNVQPPSRFDENKSALERG